jgi:phage baseplate assembly protein W
MSLAAKQTPTAKKQTYFSDFLTSFAKHPITGDLAKVTNEESVKQSMKMLVRTAFEELPYEPQRGSHLGNLLFENETPLTAELIEKTIRDTVRDMEKRAQLFDVRVSPREDINSYAVTIIFGLINIASATYQLDLVLERIR